ncbi:MAG: endopeptidase La [Acutalibacteraceae bacterium]|nr:endopeptidase La [Acutalibacteraceae bacterium]
MSIITTPDVQRLPVLALRGLVSFPGMMMHFEVGRKISLKALTYAMEHKQTIYLVAQKDIRDEEPTADNIYEIGCVARVAQILKTPDNSARVLIEGLYRARHLSFTKSAGDFYVSDVERLTDAPIKNRAVYVETLLRRAKSEFALYAEKLPKIAPDIPLTVETDEDLGHLSDYIAFNVQAPYDDKQYVLEQLNPVKRIKVVIDVLKKETEILEIDSHISEKVKNQIDENQREYYLKEQIRAINDELYGDGAEQNEFDEYNAKIESLNADKAVKEKLFGEVAKLAKMPQGSHEGTVIRGYLDTCIKLPWNSKTDAKINIKKAAKILERDFYGMKKVKERILEMLSVYVLAPEIKGQIICLAGPPGVGKTSIGKTIAECMGRRFARVSLGGIRDEAEIRGHRKTYIGAMPGKIIGAINQAGSGNPLILLDEIDKLGNDYKGDPSSALLEVLDPEQNATFVDHYIDMPYDLSGVLFITTANNIDSIPAPLLDRMEVIELSSYTREEKFNIAKKHLVAKQTARHGLNTDNFKITDKALYSLIDFYTREAGVRRLEREIASVCRKSAKIITESNTQKVTVDDKVIIDMLGKRKFTPETVLKNDEVGIVNGLAWTAVGGEIMQLEVAVCNGTGKLELTGSLGEVMRESAKAAVTYVKCHTEEYNIDADFYKNKDIHIHATEAAVPKDGPSAGVTIVTALVSALTNTPIRRDVAMTGEVTIRGRVLAIGGLKEKSMAAYRGGVKTVFIPKENEPDLAEIDDAVKKNVIFIPVSDVSDIVSAALVHTKKQEFKAPMQKEYKQKTAAVSQ